MLKMHILHFLLYRRIRIRLCYTILNTFFSSIESLLILIMFRISCVKQSDAYIILNAFTFVLLYPEYPRMSGLIRRYSGKYCVNELYHYPFTYGTSVNRNRNNLSSNLYASNTSGPQLLEPIPFCA